MPASSMSSSIASRAPRDQASANSLDGSSNNAKKISSATQPAVTTTPRTQQPSSAGSPSISTSTDPAIPVSSSSIPLSSTSTSTPLAPAAVSWAALARQALAQTPEPSSSLHPHVISDHADQSIQEIRQGKSTDRSSAIVAEELADRESLDGGSETLSVSVESTVASADVNGRRLETAESGSSSQTAPPGSDAGSSASQTSAPADAVASNHPTNVWKIRMSQQKQQQPQPQQPLAGTNQGESTMESRTPREPVSPGRHPTRRRPNNNNNNSKSGQSHDSVKSGAHNSSSASASLVDEDGFVKVQRKKAQSSGSNHHSSYGSTTAPRKKQTAINSSTSEAASTKETGTPDSKQPVATEIGVAQTDVAETIGENSARPDSEKAVVRKPPGPVAAKIVQTNARSENLLKDSPVASVVPPATASVAWPSLSESTSAHVQTATSVAKESPAVPPPSTSGSSRPYSPSSIGPVSVDSSPSSSQGPSSHGRKSWKKLDVPIRYPAPPSVAARKEAIRERRRSAAEGSKSASGMTASSGSTRPPKTSNKLEKSGDSEAATTGSNESEDGMSAGPQESNSSSSGKKNGFSSQAPPAGAGGKAHPLPSRPKVTVGASTVEKPAESTSRAVPDVGETPRSVPSSDETGAPAASAAKSLDHPSDSPVRSTTPPASSNYKGRPSSVNGHYNGRRSNGQLGGGFNRGGPNNQYQQHPHHHHHQQHPNVGPAAGMVPFHPYAAAPAPNGFAPIGPPALMTVGGSYPGRAAAQHYLVGGGSGGGGTNFPVHRGKGFNRGISIPEILLPPGSTDPVLVSSVDYATCVEWIRQQIEYYFSIENLCRDLYFRGQMNPRNGAVALRVIAGFNRIRTLTAVARAKSDELNKVKKDSKKEPSPEKTPALSDQQSALEPDGSGSPLASATTEPPSKARGLEWALELIVGCLRSSNVVEVIELSLDPSNPEPVSESTPKPAVPNTERGLRLRSNWESWVLYTTPSVGPVFVPPPPQFVNPNPNTAAQYAIGPSGPAGPAAGMNGYSLYMQPIAQLLPGQAVPAAAYMPGHSHPHPSPYHAHPISPAQQQPHHQHHPQQQQQQPPAPSLFGGNPYMNGMGMMPVPRGSGGGGGGGNGRRRHNSNHYGGAGGGGSSSGPQLHSQGEAAGSRKASSTENQQQQYQLSQNTAGESLESDAPSSGPDLKSTAVAN